MTDQDIAQIIKESMREVLSGFAPPQCALEMQRIKVIEDLAEKLSIIITGNGHPETGLVVDFSTTKKDVENFHIEMRKEINDIKEKDKEKRAREWGLIMVGLGLIATSIWGLIVQ